MQWLRGRFLYTILGYGIVGQFPIPPWNSLYLRGAVATHCNCNQSVMGAHSCRVSQEAMYACATSIPGRATIGALHNRGNSALESDARSGRRFVRWSILACQIHGPTARAIAGRGAAPIFRVPTLVVDHLSLGGGAALPLHSGDTTRPIAVQIVCKHCRSVRSRPWIRRASSELSPQTGASPTFSRRAAYSLMGVACSSPSWSERVLPPSCYMSKMQFIRPTQFMETRLA